MSTIVTGRRALADAALVGGLWGLGHAAALPAAAIAVIALDLRIDGSIAHWLDGAVAVMLIGLGAAGPSVRALFAVGRRLRRRISSRCEGRASARPSCARFQATGDHDGS